MATNLVNICGAQLYLKRGFRCWKHLMDKMDTLLLSQSLYYSGRRQTNKYSMLESNKCKEKSQIKQDGE